MEDTMKARPPKWAFDREYGSDWLKEVAWLREHGVNPVFEKTNQFGVKRYKYTKTPELFAALAIFYKQIQDERQWKRINEMLQTMETVDVTAAEASRLAGEGGADLRNIDALNREQRAAALKRFSAPIFERMAEEDDTE